MPVTDYSQLALAAAVFALGLVVALELRALVRLRHSMGRDLARVFEQLDLVRFESQQVLDFERRRDGAAVPAQPPLIVPRLQPEAGNYLAAGKMAAAGASAADIANRCGMASGEARLLVALELARGKRRLAH